MIKLLLPQDDIKVFDCINLHATNENAVFLQGLNNKTIERLALPVLVLHRYDF